MDSKQVGLSDQDLRRAAMSEPAPDPFRQLLELAPDATIVVGSDRRIVIVNCQAEGLFDWKGDELVGQRIEVLIPQCVRQVHAAHHGDFLLHPRARPMGTGQRLTALRKDGSEIPVEISLAPIRTVQGLVVVATIRDLRARVRAEQVLRKTEEQLRQAQKMEAIGLLAGGIAHDFNNLLSVILGHANLMLETMGPSDSLRGDLDELLLAGQRASELTRQLLAFSRKQVLEPRVVDVNRELGSLERMLRRVLGEDIALSVFKAEPLGRVYVDPGQLEQVILNLVVNARDAMPRGGKLTIETADVALDAAYAVDHLGATVGPHVMLAVTDTGLGMDAETRARIFEPFFTTKEKGKGTGLGLATVLGIVAQSGGHLGVYSESGRGTTFKIYLPRTDRSTEAVMSPTPPRGSLRGSETILLVEDEDQVRAVARAVLERYGYVVLDARNGNDALAVCARCEEKIDLVVTDVVMPSLTGPQLTQRLAGLRPTTRVLFMSGYPDKSIVHHGVLEEGIAFLAKPLTPDALLRKVRELLDAPVHTDRPLGGPDEGTQRVTAP